MPEHRCPLCHGPLLVKLGADGSTPVGWACPTHGVVSRVNPEITTMDMSRASPSARRHWGYQADGTPTPDDQLPEDHPRRDPGRRAAGLAAVSGMPERDHA